MLLLLFIAILLIIIFILTIIMNGILKDYNKLQERNKVLEKELAYRHIFI